MKRLIPILIFLLLIGSANGQNISDMNFEEINVDVNIDSGATITHQTGWDVDYIFANLTFFPKDDEWQDILNKNFVYGDELEEGEDYLYFKWNSPTETELGFGLDYNIKSKFKFEQVKNKRSFPVNENDIPDDIKIYLESTETINADDSEIIAQATSIAEGKDDLYQVAFDMGVWIKENIDYDLNTLTENVQQDARWVLDNREGVCDEITVLFIAMLRSVGIPAKFTSGSSYSNLINGFGNHAWAEVYFPGEGWVSFDVTYGQFGFIDAGHIKFKESLEAKESSINYGWKSNNIEVEFDPLNVKTELIYSGGELSQKAELDMNLLANNVGGGSYVPVEVKVKNLKNYYVPLDIYLTRSASIVEENVKHILLKPNEEKSVFWIIEVPEDLESGYVYTSIIEFQDYFGSSDSEDLKYAKGDDYYSLEEAEEKISQLEEESESNYNGDLEIDCRLPKKVFYTYEKGSLNCSLKNKGNVNFNNLGVCFLEDCENFDLLINGEKEIVFEFETNIESREYSVVAQNEDVVKYFYVDLEILESPNLRINGLNYDNELRYKDTGELRFELISDSEAYDVSVRLGKKEIFNIVKFDGTDSFLIPYEGSFFYNKNNILTVEYEDNNGREYLAEERININVIDIPFFVKILNFIGLI